MQRRQALGGGVRTYGLTLGLQPSQVHCELLLQAGAFRSMPGLAGPSASAPAPYSLAPRDNVWGGLRVPGVQRAPPRSQSDSLRPASCQQTSPGVMASSQREVWNARARQRNSTIAGLLLCAGGRTRRFDIQYLHGSSRPPTGGLIPAGHIRNPDLLRSRPE